MPLIRDVFDAAERMRKIPGISRVTTRGPGLVRCETIDGVVFLMYPHEVSEDGQRFKNIVKTREQCAREHQRPGTLPPPDFMGEDHAQEDAQQAMDQGVRG